jgi:signal transduction histidine kinase
MPALPGRGAFGLRGRIVGVVLVTTVATLAVAAVALLGPLEQSLRNAESLTLQKDLGRPTIRAFAALPLYTVPLDHASLVLLQRQEGLLEARLGANVYVFGYGADDNPSQPLDTGRVDTDDIGPTTDIAVAFRRRSDYSFATIDDHPFALAAIRFRSDGEFWVLAVRKSIDDLPGAVHAVQTAFLDAALAGLALTMILAIPLSARLVRRLRRLREAALELAHEGPSVEIPVDRARDEVGDLARTLSTMQQRLQRQEEARRSFVATASHELRTPLTSLDGMLELLVDDLRYEQPDLEDARALLERARAQSRRLGRLAADLLDLSRIDAQVELRSEPVELVELSRAVVAEFELGTEEREIRIALDDHAGAVWALGDPGSIARILRILLDNALRVSPYGSGIGVALRRTPRAAITVSDEGPGVHPDEREAIFRRFHRGRDTAGQAGFGLGLAIGRELAERMDGALLLEDAAGGATFTLELPAAAESAEDPLVVSERRRAAPHGTRRR